MKAKIIVVGSSNTDMSIRLDRLPKPGETILGGTFTTAAGGKGANQAVSAARAGGQVTFIARVGQDIFGDQAIDGFRRDHVNVEYVFRDQTASSGVALIFVANDGENSIAVASGANGQLSPADVITAGASFAGAGVLVMQLETPIATVQAAAELAASHGLRVILNPAPAQPLPDALYRLISILTPNQTEAALLTGTRVSTEDSAAQAAAHLRAKGVRTVIITLGGRGAFVADTESETLVPGFTVKPVDTVAAGDVFNGALAVALGESRPLLEAVRFANAAAALSVTRPGAQSSAPTRAAIESLLKS